MTTATTSPAPEGAGPGPASPQDRHARLLAAAHDGKLYAADVAALAGVQPKTITHYLWKAVKARREGTATDRHLPGPAGHEPPTAEVIGTGHSGGDPIPYWNPGDVATWLRARRPRTTTERITT